MWESLGALALNGGPWALIAFGVLAVWRGWLIPRWWYNQQLTLMDKRVSDLKATGEIWKEIAGERQEQLAILLGRVKEPMP